MDSENMIKSLVDFIKENLEDLSDKLEGELERPSDLMDCGCIDGSYDTWIEVLDFLGIKHKYIKQSMWS